VHAHVSGQTISTDPLVIRAADQLLNVEHNMGFTIEHRELMQEFMLTETIQVRRIIDAIGYDRNGQSCVIDYKTARVRWPSIAGHSSPVQPEALGWQTVMYLYPPPQAVAEEAGFSVWPQQMYYIVVPNKTGGFTPQVIDVRRDREREVQMLEQMALVELAHEHGMFPKSKGYHCTYCSFHPMCYDVPEWESLYERREK
jgi:CRISPR/Cas system-associated exonuclease Cas4 (RecB family)